MATDKPMSNDNAEASVHNANTNFSQITNNLNTNIIKDSTGTRRVLMGVQKGQGGSSDFYGIKVSREGYDVVTTADENLRMSSDFAFAKEVYLPLHPQWDNNWTAGSTYVDVEGSLAAINFDDWADHSWYFEMIGKVDGGTGYYRLYNITDGAEVDGSEITTTSTSFERIRSGSLTKPTGTKEFKIQHRQTGGGAGDLVNSAMSRSIFRIDT